MKLKINSIRKFITACLLVLPGWTFSQVDSASKTDKPEAPSKTKPVKNTFESVWIIDNQTVMVPVKKTFEMDVMHRFGTVKNGYEDFWGFFASSNIRLGVSYSPINNLNLGLGITKSSMLWDFNAKYAIIKQTKHKYPVSVTYYGNAAIDTRKEPTIYDGSDIKHQVEKLYYFNQLIIARKITKNLSLQVAVSHSHQNAVSGYYIKNDSTGTEIYRSMKNEHFAISFAGRYKLTNVMAVIFNYDQPLTKHPEFNPDPNLALGLAITTSSHSFQLFVGNYGLLNPQRNSMFNSNSPFSYVNKSTGKNVKGGNFVIGFNITRLWNY